MVSLRYCSPPAGLNCMMLMPSAGSRMNRDRNHIAQPSSIAPLRINRRCRGRRDSCSFIRQWERIHRQCIRD